MAGAETTYVVATSSAVVLERGRAQVSRLRVERDGVTVAPTASGSSYALISPAGVELSDATVTINGDDIAEVTIPALDLPSTLGYGLGYSERWTLVLDGVARSYRRGAVLARFELAPPVSQADLVAGEYPDLVQSLGDYAADLQEIMDGAWGECLRWLWRQATPAQILVEPSDVFDWYRHEVLSRVFKSQFAGRGNNDRARTLWDYHREAAAAAKAALKPIVDRDHSGVQDSLVGEPVARQIHPNMPPSRRTARPWRY